MLAATRIGDMSIGIGSHGRTCCPHHLIGFAITGSPDTLVNSRNQVRLGDILIHNCPHCPVGFIITASPDVFTNILGASRMGDLVNETCGVGRVVTGSEDTFVN